MQQLPGCRTQPSQPTVIAVMGIAGGVATSTTAHHLAAGLAEYGFRVLAVDFTRFAGVSFLAGLEHLTQGIVQVLEGERTIKQAAVKTNFGADLVPSNRDWARIGWAASWTERRAHYTPSAMFRGLEYDFAILDCHRLDQDPVASFALRAADHAILTTAGPIEEQELMAKIAALRSLDNPRLSVLGILMARATRTRFHKTAYEALRHEVDGKLFHTTIHEAARFREAVVFDQTIFAIDGKYRGAAEYRQFVDEVLARLGMPTGLMRTPQAAVKRSREELRQAVSHIGTWASTAKVDTAQGE